MTELYTDKDIQIKFKDNDIADNADISVNREKVESKFGSQETFIQLDELSPDILIPIEFDYKGTKRTYYIQTLPENFPQVKFEGDNRIDRGKFYYMNIFAGKDKVTNDKTSNDYIIKYDNTGNVKFYKENNEREIANFDRFDAEDGFSGYSYFVQDDKGLEFNHIGYRKGVYVIMDENYNIVDLVTLEKTEKYNPNHPPKAELHDIKVLGKDHYLLFDSYNGYSHEHNKQKQETFIQEIQGDDVIWEWYSGDHEVFATAPIHRESMGDVLMHQPSLDNIHTNSVSIDPKDGNVVISNRNMDNVVKISKETGEILWIFGGEYNQFDYNGMEPFSRQHDAEFNEKGELTLYDNGVEKERGRGLIIDLDEDNKKVISYKEYIDDDQAGVYTGNIEEFG